VLFIQPCLARMSPRLPRDILPVVVLLVRMLQAVARRYNFAHR
jgi:hypothetical protein